jgi:3'-5' exoribonuclease
MKTIFVKDIRENQKLESTFLVKHKGVARTRTGNPYLNLTLGDTTGEIQGKVWDHAEPLGQRFQKDDFIRVQATAVTYQNVLQLTISSLTCCPPAEIDITDFLPQAKHDREETFTKLKTIVTTVKNEHLRKLLDLFLADEDFTGQLKNAPAAKKLHHVYVGGLLEHTLSVSNLILQVGDHYGGLNRDLLLTGGILHDIGKVHELTYARAFDYSDDGRLLGHIMLGIEMINEKISVLPDFPHDVALELKHLIISHHGQYEYGSPKRPKTLEALILSYLDDLDAKVEDLQSFIQREQENPSKCAGYHQMLNRYIYKSLPAEGDGMHAETDSGAAGYGSPADTSGEEE